MPRDEIFEAIENGDSERVKSLLAENPARASAKDDNGISAILQARYWGRDEIVQSLLATKPELDICEAAALGDSDRVRELLKEDPERARAWSPDGFTPLHLACFFGHPELAKFLVERGAEVTATSINAMVVTPLHSAAASRQEGITRFLLERGAEVNARQAGGFTALHAAAQNGDWPMVDLLLRRGANPAIRTESGDSAVELARQEGHEEVATKLAARMPR